MQLAIELLTWMLKLGGKHTRFVQNRHSAVSKQINTHDCMIIISNLSNESLDEHWSTNDDNFNFVKHNALEFMIVHV